jgi:hypothetical protein
MSKVEERVRRGLREENLKAEGKVGGKWITLERR